MKWLFGEALASARSIHPRCTRWSCGVLLVATVVCAGSTPQPAIGTITAMGEVLPNPLVPNTLVDIAVNSTGSILIDGGSTFQSSSANIGHNEIGSVVVTDTGSSWAIDGSAEIGFSGIGRLDIRDGGSVNTGSGTLRLGTNSGGRGTVVVENLGSVLQTLGPVTVGSSGAGVLRIADQGIVNMRNTNNQLQVGSSGRVEFADGLFKVEGTVTNNGVIAGAGELFATAGSPLQNNGRIEAGSGQRLLISGTTSGSVQNNGIIDADGGEIEFTRLVSTGSSGSTLVGQVTLRDALVRFALSGTSGAGLNNSGALSAYGGVNDVYGRITNLSTGKIAVTNDSVLTFHHTVTNQNGTISVFDGSTAIFLQDLTMSGGTLLADLGGAEGFGHVEVVGNVQLGNGSLAVNLANGFVPQAGDSFSLIAAGGTISGSPTLGTMPALPNGLLWDLDVEPHRVVLNVLPLPAGDYNADGTVDAADYVIWRKTLNQTGMGLAADGNHDGTVDDADYAVWTANFGATTGGGSIATVASAIVPEPATCSLLLIALVAACQRSVRRGTENR